MNATKILIKSELEAAQSGSLKVRAYPKGELVPGTGYGIEELVKSHNKAIGLLRNCLKTMEDSPDFPFDCDHEVGMCLCSERELFSELKEMFA